MNRIWRAAYFVAHRLLRLVWYVTGTRPPGAFVAVWCQGRILAIQTSYQPFHTFPGGISRRGEDPRLSAVRELQEEVGIVLEPQALTPVTSSPLRHQLERGRVTLFSVDLATPPVLHVDHKEIVSAEFLDASDARVATLWPPFRAYVEESMRLARDHAPNG